jgi:RNA polymerase sporulation-specific sigma factor
LQEAHLALYRAATSFDEKQTAVTFGLYAKICIRNRLISALRRQKRLLRKQPQISAAISPPISSDFDLISIKNQYGHLLTRYEEQVLNLRLKGLSYKEISKKLAKDPKSIDNALCRIRTKIRNAKNEP